VARSGCSWLQLPHESPLGQTLFRYFKQWPADSTADRIYDVLRDRVRDGAGWDPVASAAIVHAQMRILMRWLRLSDASGDPVPRFAFNAGHDPTALCVDLAGTRAQIAVRTYDHRVLCRDPPPREPGTTGRPAAPKSGESARRSSRPGRRCRR
jgi:hypothetical protein